MIMLETAEYIHYPFPYLHHPYLHSNPEISRLNQHVLNALSCFSNAFLFTSSVHDLSLRNILCTKLSSLTLTLLSLEISFGCKKFRKVRNFFCNVMN